jgi:hypothetical protein
MVHLLRLLLHHRLRLRTLSPLSVNYYDRILGLVQEVIAYTNLKNTKDDKALAALLLILTMVDELEKKYEKDIRGKS